MPRPRRRDLPGDWFHVMNRGVGRRTMFENPVDVDRFLKRIGEAVAAGWMEVHAFSVLATHFHLLVRSPCGSLSRALHGVQADYSRHFNRTRDRDGPLVRGRYTAKLVDSLHYRRVLVGYIDHNAPRAGLCQDPADHPHASAQAYLRGGGPIWLTRDWIEEEVAAGDPDRLFTAAGYAETFLRGGTDAHAAWIDARSSDRRRGIDPTDALMAGGAPAVLEWVEARARIADGIDAGQRLVPVQTVLARVDRVHDPEFAAFALRELAGLTHDETGIHLGCSCEQARRRHRAAHARAVSDPTFREALAHLAHAALQATYGKKRPTSTAKSARDVEEVPGT